MSVNVPSPLLSGVPEGEEPPDQARHDAILANAEQAQATNRTYLATPAAATAAARLAALEEQVRLLTRQLIGHNKLLLRDLATDD